VAAASTRRSTATFSGVGFRVGAVEHLGLDLECHQAVTALDLDRELAELHAVPAHDLAARTRPFARDRDPNGYLDQPCGGRREQEVSHRGVVAPHDPAFRITLGAERG